MNKEDLYGKVIYLKKRVWTIYAEANNRGVFCYQGVKPYESFQFDYEKDETRNIHYFSMEDIQDTFIEGEEIEWFMKKMENADKKELTQQHAIDFFAHLTGHSKDLISKSIVIDRKAIGDVFNFKPGSVRYTLWKNEGALLLSHNTNSVSQIAYFDFLTFDPHGRLNEKQRDAIKQEIIDNYINN